MGAGDQIRELEDRIMLQLREKGKLELEFADAMKVMHFLDWARNAARQLEEAAK